MPVTMLQTSLMLASQFKVSIHCCSVRSLHRVALVGSGPSSFYSAKYLLDQDPTLHVDMYEKLPVPFGLVRFGVAPDHPEVKSVQTTFEEVARSKRFRYFGNVTVDDGKTVGHVSLTNMLKSYSGVILAYGASSDNDLKIPNENLNGIYSARRFVNWYNGHPDYVKTEAELFSLKGIKNVVIVGQGNVAVDCARILSTKIDELAVTDITSEALDVLAKSDVQTVTLIGRRGHVQAAFTIKEFRELTKLEGVSLKMDPTELAAGLTDASKQEIKDNRPKKRITELIETTSASSSAASSVMNENKTIDFRFLLSPIRFNSGVDSSTGEKRVSSITVVRNKLTGDANKQQAVATTEEMDIPCQLVLKSVGYKSEPNSEVLPFDRKHNVVPSRQGRVVIASADAANKNSTTGLETLQQPDHTVVKGLYVAGWLKRGPTGIIGSNITDAKETVASVLADLRSGALRECSEEESEDPKARLLQLSEASINLNTKVVDWEGYQRINETEMERGKKMDPPKEREKIISRDELVKIGNVNASDFHRELSTFESESV